MTRLPRPCSVSFFWCIFGCIGLCGCSKPEFNTAQVTGVCTCKGEPMSGGVLILAPVGETEADKMSLKLGKPANAEIQPDGSFTMSTYGKNDGAVVGKHRVILKLVDRKGTLPKQPCKKAAPDLIVEVVAGRNELDIDLAGQ